MNNTSSDFLPLIALGAFGWSAYEYYSGNTELAFYLIGVSAVVILMICAAFIYAINSQIDSMQNKLDYELDRNFEQQCGIQNQLIDVVRNTDPESNSKFYR